MFIVKINRNAQIEPDNKKTNTTDTNERHRFDANAAAYPTLRQDTAVSGL